MAENRELALVLKLVADNFQSELKKSGGMLGDFNKFVSDWKTQLVAAGGALFAIAKSTANYGEELLLTSAKVGINVEALAGLQHAAKLAHLSHEDLTKGLKFLSVNMVEASRHTGDGEALFRRLGVSATDATGQLRPTEAVLLDLADVFANAKDGAGKAEVAVKLFGKAGLDLIPFMNQGKFSITEMIEEARRLGLMMSKEDAEAAHQFNKELEKLQALMRGITLQMGNELIPSFTTFFRIATESMGGAGSWIVTETFKGLSEMITFTNAELQALIVNWNAFSDKRKQPEFKGMIEQQRQLNLHDIYKQMNERLVEIRPEAFGIVAPIGSLTPGAAKDGKTELAQGADQEKLGKAKLEIYLEMNRAIDIHNSLMAEQASVDRAAYLHLLDFQDQEKKNDEDWQERHGRMIVEQTQLEVKIRDEARANEQQGLIDNAQAWAAYYDQLGGNSQDFLAHKTDLLRAQLAKELDFTKEQSAELLAAWQQRDSLRADQILAASPKTGAEKETIELNTMRQNILNQRAASDDFFAGWAEGMRNYVKETGNGFNLATDMARQTAQAMQQGFQTFFFDLMDNKIKTFRDMMRSMLNFVKQIIAQIASQLVVSKILGLVASGFGGGASVSTPGLSNNFGNFGVGAATGGQVVRRYAMGGPVPGSGMQDTIPALLTPGEYVLSRGDMADVKRGLGVGSPINIAITVNAQGGRQQSGTGAAPNFKQLARDLSKLVESKLIEEQRPGGLLAGGMA